MICNKADAKFKVQVRSNRRGVRYLYFTDLASAQRFCTNVFEATGRILSIVEA